MPKYLLDLHFRRELSCRRVVEAADREEAESVGSRLVHAIDPTEFDDDPRYPDTTFCADVTNIDDALVETLYRRVVDDWVVIRDIPGMGERLRNFMERNRSTADPTSAIGGGLDDR